MLVTLRGQRVKLKSTWEMFGKDDEKIDLIILDQLVESILQRNAVNGKNNILTTWAKVNSRVKC